VFDLVKQIGTDEENRLKTKILESNNETKIEHLESIKNQNFKNITKRKTLANIEIKRLLAKLEAFDSSLAKNCFQIINNCDCDIETIELNIEYLNNYIYNQLIPIFRINRCTSGKVFRDEELTVSHNREIGAATHFTIDMANSSFLKTLPE
ncbi:22587_t:CDS:2, partial [Racocetra persica]